MTIRKFSLSIISLICLIFGTYLLIELQTYKKTCNSIKKDNLILTSLFLSSLNKVEISKIAELDKLELDNRALCFYFSRKSCMQCVESVYERLIKYKRESGVRNILILTDYRNERKIKYFESKFSNESMRMLIVKNDGIDFTNGSKPMLFVYNFKEKKASYIFYPEKALLYITDEYLKKINLDLLNLSKH